MFRFEHTLPVLRDCLRGLSPFRALQNLYLGSKAWGNGLRVLDVGAKPSGNKMIVALPNADIVYVDRAPESPGVVDLDITAPPPPGLGTFDCILLLNVLEHVYDVPAALRFVHRSLRPGGEVVIVTPYLYPYHKAPLDHYRFSADWYREAARREGFEITDLTPLSFGVVSDIAGFGLSWACMFKSLRWFRPLAVLLYGVPLLFDAALASALKRSGRSLHSYHRNPLGYAAVLTPLATGSDVQ